MAINERLIDTEVAAAADGDGGTGNQEEGLILHLDANDVDSYDGDGDIWYDITNHEYTPAVDPAEHFNTVLYTGDGTDNNTKSITGVGFEPDLVWIKNREASSNHYITDSVRGDEKHIYTESTSAENGNSISAYGGVLLDSDGFTVNRGSNSSSVGTNANNDTYVAWCFKAGGAAVSNTDGTVTSQVSVNNDLGFSIVKYTGTTGADDVGHGLDVAPDLVIAKTLDGSDSNSNWIVYASPLSGQRGALNLDISFAASTTHFRADPNSSVLKLSSHSSSNVNRNGEEHIAYCFASKRGVSKVGSYTGSTGSVKVYTGFQPAFILIKNTGASDSWAIIDNKRPSGGGERSFLYPDTNDDEDVFQSSYTGVTFNGDGFTLDDDDSHLVNENGKKFIYLAFAAEKPDSLIDDTDLELHLDAASFPQKGESGYSNTPSTWTDSSGNGNNGTISGATFDSELGNWLDFDGSNDIVNLGNSLMNNYESNSFSFSCWFNLPSSVIDGNPNIAGNPINLAENCIFTKADYLSGAGLHGFIYGIENGEFAIVQGTQSYNGYAVRTSGASLSADTWHHVVITKTSSNVYNVYIDGSLQTLSVQSSADGGFTTNANSRNAYIMHNATTTYSGPRIFYTQGKIGQVRIYSSTLTADEVMQNYRFTKNDYPNGYNGTISGATWNSGGYFDFDGNDYVQTSFNQNLSTFSFSIWAKFDSVNTISFPYTLISKNGYYAESISDFPIQITQQESAIKAIFSTGDDYTADYTLSYSSVSANTWYFITVVADFGNTIKLYINGDEEGSVSYTTALSQNNRSITLGRASFERSGGVGNSGLDGKISKFKIHDKALTQAEITALYNEGE